MSPVTPNRLGAMRRSSRLAAALSALLLAGLLPAPAALGGVPGVTELFFSEYIEGSSNNKALEIYNGTGAAVNLATGVYNVQMFFNGSASAGLTINLSGTVADDDVFVLAQSAANATILAQADQTNGSGWFNGDDAVVLRKGTTVIDVIGQIGFDPGVEWGTGLTSTMDNTLRRKTSVITGDANGADAFDPAGEWDGFATDTFSALGAHPASDVAPVVAVTTPSNGSAGVARNANLTVTFNESVAVAGSWFDITCVLSGSHTAVASAGPATSFTLDPDTDFAANELCTVTVFASGVTDVDVDDPPDGMAANASFSFTTIDDSVCGDPATFIHAAQGTGSSTPLSGSIAVEGIVVGDYQADGQFGGYFVQEEDADADVNPATSEGIFVFNTSFPVALGDKVRVRGTIGEAFNKTQLSSVSNLLPCSTGNALPTATDINFPLTAVAALEAFEGMRVSVDQLLTVTEVFGTARFGEVALSVSGRLANPTNVVEPGAPALARQDLNNRSRILLDDGASVVLDPTRYPQGGLSASNTLRVGDTLPSVAGVLDFQFSLYRIQPVLELDEIGDFTHANPRPVAPTPVGGNLQVAAFNVLNFFNGDGLGGGFPTARGAGSPLEFERQKAKIISAMLTLDADIYSMSELENDASGELSAIDDLVDALNLVAGDGTFDYIDTGIIGTDAIKVGILYKPAVVSPVGAYAILRSSDDPRFVDTLNRPALAQTFEVADGGGRLTIIANHLKSKGSACPEDIPTPVNDGQQNCNVTRTNAARALVDWAASDPTGSGDRDVLMIGDLNSYAKEDPIDVFRDAGYTNEVARFLGDNAYSFVFQGQSGYLDHALTSPTLTAQVTGVTEWHINADEPVGLDYNIENKTLNQQTTLYAPDPYKSSDHDPLVVGIQVADRAADGLLPPIRDGATAKAGQVLPVKWSLGGFEGLDILFETPQVFVCADWPLGDSVDADSAGASALTFNAGDDVYTFAWKTLKSWADSCRTIEVTFDDGSYITADVNFTK